MSLYTRLRGEFPPGLDAGQCPMGEVPVLTPTLLNLGDTQEDGSALMEETAILPREKSPRRGLSLPALRVHRDCHLGARQSAGFREDARPLGEPSVISPGPPQMPTCLMHPGNEVASPEDEFVPSPQEAQPRGTRRSPEQTRTLLPQRQKEKQPSPLPSRPGPAPPTCSR